MFSFLHTEALRYYPCPGPVFRGFNVAEFPDPHFDRRNRSCTGSCRQWNATLCLSPNHRFLSWFKQKYI